MNDFKSIKNKLMQEIDILERNNVPKFIFVGGVPGAGKTLLIEKAKKDFINHDFEVIDPDLFRQHFKKSKNVEDTVEDVNNLEIEMLLYSIKTKKNVIHVGTLRAYEYIDKLICEQIINSGYEIYFYLIVTNNIESALSTYERYIIDKKEKKPFPRLNKYEYLSLANEGFINSIISFSKNDYFKNIKCFTRGPNGSFPVQFNIDFKSVPLCIMLECESQLSKIDLETIWARVNSIKANLETEQELLEFNKVVNLLIEPIFFSKCSKKNLIIKKIDLKLTKNKN